MRTTILVVVGAAIALTLGFAVAGMASSSSSKGVLGGTTNESTTETHQVTKWTAALRPGAEVPKPTGVKAGAAGTFTITVTDKGATYTATWKLTFKSLTGKAVAAHIHKGKAGKAGPVAISLCGPCTSGKSGTATVSEAAFKAMKAGLTYVNVHTAANAGGEIRGQVKKIG